MSQCPNGKSKNCSCEFCCPKELSAKTVDDCFASPFMCPNKIPTQRFASPNSPLPLDKLDAFQKCIEAANDLLRTLGNRSDLENTRQLQLHFLRLKGIGVKVTFNCGEAHTKELSGILGTAGRNFIQLNSVGHYIFIPYELLISLSKKECAGSNHQEQEFIDADTVTRREMVLNFGDFVAKRPELVNLFFGITLYQQLQNYLGEDMRITTEDPNIIEGTLFEADEGKIRVKNTEGSTEIKMEQICFLEVMNMK